MQSHDDLKKATVSKSGANNDIDRSELLRMFGGIHRGSTDVMILSGGGA